MNRNPKPKQEIPSLAKLREMGCARPLPSKGSPEQAHQVRPGHWRKVYGRQNQQCRWVYMPIGIQEKTLKPMTEIAALADKRTLDELTEHGEEALKQLLYRAHTGDERAIFLYAGLLRRAINSLDFLATNQLEKVQAEAERQPRWPVLLSLNPQDIKRAKKHLSRLHVGQKAETPTRPGQRLDLNNFWTVLANEALNVCQTNRVVWVPILLKHATGARRERHSQKFWGKKVSATYFYLPGGTDIIIITDWQWQCAKLSEPITTANFKDWWSAIKGCVLEHWRRPHGNYAKALEVVGQPQQEEWRRRSTALDRVKQALESLTHLQ
jgi:hypothetical protein